MVLREVMNMEPDSSTRCTVKDKEQWTQLPTQKISRSGGWIVIFEDFQNLTRQGPEHPPLTLKLDLLWGGRWTKLGPRGQSPPKLFQVGIQTLQQWKCVLWPTLGQLFSCCSLQNFIGLHRYCSLRDLCAYFQHYCTTAIQIITKHPCSAHFSKMS